MLCVRYCCLLVLFFCSNLSFAKSLFANNDKLKALESIEELRENKFYDKSLILLKQISRDLTIDDINVIFDSNIRDLKRISLLTTKRTPTCFVFPAKYRKPSQRRYLSYEVCDFVQSTYEPIQYLTPHQRTILDEKIGNVSLPKDEMVKATIAHYEFLKRNTVILEKVLQANNIVDITIYQKIKDFKEHLGKEFCDFISYEIVSPHIWILSKKLTIVNYPLDFFAKNIKRKNAMAIAAILSKSMHKKWLTYINQDIVKQFFCVQSDMKAVFGKALYEEIKVFSTLAKSLDPSKKRGADAWWEEK